MSTGTQMEVVMPQMGVSVSEGTITKWLKQPGEAIARDEPLLEISTDKVDTEVPSPGEGVLAEILVQEGQTVDVGTVLGRIGPAGSETAREEPAPAPAQTEQPAAEIDVAATAPEPASASAPEPAAAPAPVAAAPQTESTGNGRAFVSPVVARIAAEHGVDPNAVSGSGTGGRVTKKDILAFIESGAQAPAAVLPGPPSTEPAPPTPEPAPIPEPAPVPRPPSEAPEPQTIPIPEPAPEPPTPRPPTQAQPAPEPVLATGETLEPMTAMRRGIAEHMRRSLDTSAHVTSAIEVDMSRVVALRKKLKPEYERTHGVNVTYLAF
ncbi:MAG: E3 binding domain-containing protein, partial [Actinobacteria bacterium]|nr:E3 binding domain-containing protein [Actinomycetota bacterium]